MSTEPKQEQFDALKWLRARAQTCREEWRRASASSFTAAADELAAWRTLQAWGLTPEIVHEFVKGQQMRIYAAQLEYEELERVRAELSAAREQVRETAALGRDIISELYAAHAEELRPAMRRRTLDAISKLQALAATAPTEPAATVDEEIARQASAGTLNASLPTTPTHPAPNPRL